LQDERSGGEEPSHRSPASITRLERGFGDALSHLEGARTFRALVLVGRHEIKKYMARMRVSRNVPLLLLLALLLSSCATTSQDDEIRKLEARSSYEAGVKSIADGRVSLGLASLKQAVEIEPTNALYHNAVGAVLLNVGRFPDAQVEFQKAVELDPTYADAYHNLGSSFAEQGKWEDAVASYKKALAQTIYASPENTYNNLGY